MNTCLLSDLNSLERFFFYSFRKLQEKAETSYTLITEEVEVLI